MQLKYTKVPVEDRFWSKVRVLDQDSCWEWQAARNASGYGRFSFGHAKWIGAHRFSYELAHGGIPANAHILHSCDNPPCVNPKHLRAGTNHDNILDMCGRGRANHGGKHNGNARLTESSVREIRYGDWSSWTNAQIGQRFGVSWETIRQIRNGTRWKGI